MKKTVSEIIVIDMIFVSLLAVSAIFKPPFSYVIYCIAFILPISLMHLIWHGTGREFFSVSLSATKEGIGLGFLLCAPFCALVFLLSLLTSFLVGLIPYEAAPVSVEGNLFVVIFLHALVPAFFEELLFRYIPIKALGAYSIKNALIYSSLIFAFAHCNIFQLPYAFVSGIILSALVIMTGSILPSFIVHFVNNLASILWQRSEKGAVFLIIFFSALGVLTLISAAVIIAKRKKLAALISPILKDKATLILTPLFVVYAIVTTVFTFI